MGQITDASIEKYKNHFETEDKWNWSEEWDGKIEKLCKKLAEEGFEVTHIYRKGKVQVKWPRNEQNVKCKKSACWLRLQILSDDIKELTFSSDKILIHFDMGVPIKRSRRF